MATKSATKSKQAPAKATKPTEEKLSRPPCMCGCGGFPKGKRAHFVPGHDARLRGILLRANLATDEDATDFEREESAREIANVPDMEWATKWHTAKHGGK